MELTKETLELITDYASSLMSARKIAIILELSEMEFCSLAVTPGNPIYSAYQKGKLICEAEMKKAQLTLGKQGSQPAFAQCEKYRKEQEADEIIQ